MSEGEKGAGKRRLHLNSDELPGRPFDGQSEGDEQVGAIKKRNPFAGSIAGWLPIASQRLSTARQRLLPPKR